MCNNRVPLIGDVYYVKFEGTESVQNGWRPGIVLQNNVGNRHSPNLIVLPITSSIKKVSQPTHVLLPSKDTGLPRDSMVLCENPECVSKEKVGEYITTIPDKFMSDIAQAHILATSAISFLNPNALLSIWFKATRLNSNT